MLGNDCCVFMSRCGVVREWAIVHGPRSIAGELIVDRRGTADINCTGGRLGLLRITSDWFGLVRGTREEGRGRTLNPELRKSSRAGLEHRTLNWGGGMHLLQPVNPSAPA